MDVELLWPAGQSEICIGLTDWHSISCGRWTAMASWTEWELYRVDWLALNKLWTLSCYASPDSESCIPLTDWRSTQHEHWAATAHWIVWELYTVDWWALNTLWTLRCYGSPDVATAAIRLANRDPYLHHLLAIIFNTEEDNSTALKENVGLLTTDQLRQTEVHCHQKCFFIQKFQWKWSASDYLQFLREK